MKKLMTLLMVVVFAGSLLAQVTITGDAQVRPRLDVKDWGGYGNPKDEAIDHQEDGYYMYRFRINLAAKIGGGWYAKARIAHYGYAEYGFTSGLSMGSNLGGDRDVTAKPSLAFTQLFLGYKTESLGFMGGQIPMNGLANPMLDVHYYPNKMIDIPWTIYGLGSHFGFAGWLKAGPGKIGASATLDVNSVSTVDTLGTDHNDHDTYTFGVDYNFKVAGFGLQPALYYTVAGNDVAAPMTYGINITTPKFAGFTFGATFAMTSQTVITNTDSAKATGEYTGNFIRLKASGKLGPGSIVAWYDMATRTDTRNKLDDEKHDFSYLWLMYKYTAYKGDHGAVIIAPRWRMIGEKVTNAMDFSRQKIECLVIAKFK